MRNLAVALVVLCIAPWLVPAADGAPQPGCKSCQPGRSEQTPAKAAPAAKEQPASKQHAASADEVQLTEQDRGRTGVVSLGKMVVLRLPGNRPAGFNWELVSLSSDALRQVGKPEYVPARERPHAGAIAGAFIFRFKAVKAGKCALRLKYLRSGDKKNPPVQAFSTTVVVKQE